EVRAYLALVAPNRRPIDTGALELVVEEEPRARPGLAIDEDDVGTGEIGELSNPARIASSNDQSLLPARQCHDDDPPARQESSDERNVVLASLGVEEVAGRDIGVAATERDQTGEAAHRRDIEADRRREA